MDGPLTPTRLSPGIALGLALLGLWVAERLAAPPYPLTPMVSFNGWWGWLGLPLLLWGGWRGGAALLPAALGAPLLLVAVLDVAHAGGPPEACGPGLRVLSANLLMVHPDPAPLAAEILAADADLLLLQEFSPTWSEALEAAGVRARWRHGVEVVRDDSFGSAIWSRAPLLDAGFWNLDDLPQTRAKVALGQGVVEVWNVHTLPPRTAEYTAWHLAQVEMIAELAAGFEGALLLGGDFNATAHGRFSRDMRRGFDDAWEIAGRGPGWTWPNGLFPVPPMRLDHLFLSPDLTITEIRLGEGAGSDHRPILATLAPRAGGALCPATGP